MRTIRNSSRLLSGGGGWPSGVAFCYGLLVWWPSGLVAFWFGGLLVCWPSGLVPSGLVPSGLVAFWLKGVSVRTDPPRQHQKAITECHQTRRPHQKAIKALCPPARRPPGKETPQKGDPPDKETHLPRRPPQRPAARHACWDSTPPPVDRITDMSKNITLATTSLRLVKIGEHQSFLWGHWYPCFGLLVMTALYFKARVDTLACVLCHLHAMKSKIHVWCDTCWPLGSQHGSWAILIHILANKHWWGSIFCATPSQRETRQADSE